MADKQTVSTYNKIASYYKKTHDTVDFWKEEYSNFERMLRGKKVLDVGCGFGRDAKYFSDKGFDVVGVDASSEMIKLARDYAPSARFIVQDMQELDVGPEKFDGVWCNASFLHIRKEDADSVLSRFAKVLNNNGILFVSVKQGDGEKYVTYPDGTKRFFAYYSEIELKHLLEKRYFSVKLAYVRKDNDGDTWICMFCRKLEEAK